MQSSDERRVIVTRGFADIYTMQVCAIEDATEKEVLEVCNSENRAGTAHGWVRIERNGERGPVPCQDMPGRVHYLVVC